MKLLRNFRCANKGVSLWLVALLIFDLLGSSFFAFLIAPSISDAAVVTIDSTASSADRSNDNTGSQTVFISDQVGYAFYRDSTGQCVYSKTSNAGATWETPVLVDSQTDCIRISVWYDRWTPGDAGSNIHIITMDTSADALFYNQLNTSVDTLLLGSSPVNTGSNSGQGGTFTDSINTMTITKATDGEIYTAVNDNGDSYAVSCSSLCNLELSWSEVGTSPFDNRNDHNILMPLSGGDILAINRDISANVIRSNVWDGSAWGASWTTVDTNVVESTEYEGGMSAAVDLATGNIYLAYVNDNDSLTDDNDDIRTAVYDGSAWTVMTNVLTNEVGRGLIDASIAIDQNNGDVYVAYTIQDTAGSAGTASIYYKESTNGMTSWGSEVGPVNTTPGDLRKPSLDPSNDQRLYVTWHDGSVSDRFGETLDNIGPDTTVSALGTQAAEVRANTSDNYVGGTFVIESLVANTLSSVTITENGTVDASAGLENIKLFYDLDTSSPYDCASESYSGVESQYGSTDTDGFSADNGTSTFTGGLSLGPTQTFCGYVVYDTTSAAADASEIQLEISDPPNDVVVAGSDPYPGEVVALAGATTVVSPDLTQTHYHWRNDDGTEVSATSRSGGVEDTRLPALSKLSPVRLRLGVSVEGSTSSDPTAYKLEYTESAETCSVSTGWIGVDAAADAFSMYDSPSLTDGADTTNIAVSSGGVTDENTTFLTPNGAVQDVGDVTGSITLETTEFLELEYSIVSTASAEEGVTYCFRLTDNGAPLGVYSSYPRATINADITASTTGSHISTVDIPDTDVYFGGALSLIENDSSHTVTSITITENGTIDASSGLENIKLYYDLDTSAPYNCVSESYAGTEPQYGSTDTNGFSGNNGTSTFTGSQLITTTQTMCLYIVADVTAAAANGETIQFSINSAVDDVIAGSASVAPSAAVTIASSTTALGAILSQTHYHWRNDDGSETGATSASGGAEDTPITEFQVDTPVRLRLSVSNEGATTTPETVYALQYGTLITTCSAVAVWTDVSSSPDDPWDEYDSVNLTHGNNTTNINEVNGGVTDENATFYGTAGVRETAAATASTTLTKDQFAEFEFSITSTLATSNDTTYCFRLVANGQPLDTYDQYAQLSTVVKQDFKIQNGTTIIDGTTTETIIAGVDYDAPASSSLAFIRITNTHHTGAGDIVGGGSQDVEEVTAYIQNPGNLDTSITFERDRNLNETFINWEIIEFVGQPGTDNEMIVRDQGVVSMTLSNLTAVGPVATVDDDNDVAVFITGAASDDASNDFFAAQVTAEWDSVNDQPVFTRSDGGGAAANISYAVVEFTGLNWKVQRVEHSYTAAGEVETEAITAVNSLAQTFLHTQKRMGANVQVASHGHQVFLSSIGAVSFMLATSADVGIEQVSVAWVIENTQTGIGAMEVERQRGTTVGGAEPLTLSIALGSTLGAVNNSSIFGSSYADGTNSAHPRSIAGLRIASTTHYELWRSDTGTDLYYRVEVVQWPVADLAYRQNYYRWYRDNNLLTPDDAWPEGGTDLGENTSITEVDDPPGVGDLLRLRMTIQARNANWPAEFVQFKLQFAERVTTCTAIATWYDLGDNSSTTALWRGYAATGTIDGTDLSGDPPTPGDLLISVADVAGTHEHNNNSATNTYVAYDGEDVEYDWFVQHNGASADTPYCFRMVESNGTDFSGYLQYPQLRTADFTPTIGDWRWYDDPLNETPTSAVAATNTAPTDIVASSTFALRVVVPEDKSVPGTDVRFKLQFSEDVTFATVRDVVASSSCSYSSVWCYVDGAAEDNTTITTSIIGSADSCSGAVGAGCGTHNSSGDYIAGHDHGATDSQEYSFTIQNTLLRPNAVYYFRLYDISAARAVSLADDASYPSIVGEGASLVFTISGLDEGTATAGITTDATTTATSVDFGVLPVGSDVTAAQRLSVDTNSIEGYRVWKFARQSMTNGNGVIIPPLTTTNASPASWASGCLLTETGCIGYHTTDATLNAGSARFAPVDTYAALHSNPEEIMYSSLPANESHDVVYRVLVNEDQPAGDYETDIVYIATPVY